MLFLPKSFLSRFSGDGGEPSSSDARVGIFAFEAARAMSRLVTLHRALTPSSIDLLQKTTTTHTAGVSHLNSYDRLFFLRVACAEMLDELHRAASAISRLASRSRSLSPWPRGFDHLYSDLVSGVFDVDHKVVLPKKDLERKLKKMEAFISSASTLYAQMEMLAEMEASERRLEKWKNYSGPITAGPQPTLQQNPPGADAFLKKLAAQRRVVNKSKDDSLWGQSKRRTSELMARAAVTLFLRICDVFNKFLPELPVVDASNGRFRSRPNPLRVKIQSRHFSGPLHRSRPGGAPAPTITITKFSGPITRNATPMAPVKTDLKKWSAMTMQPPAGTVGAAGLALRYADLIQLSEKMFRSPECFGQEDRAELYRLLPTTLRAAIRTRLKGVAMLLPSDRDGLMETAERVLRWLAPMANDTNKWFSDRSCEKQRIDPATKVLLLQTLQISDRRKAEEAIVDVLVGLSLVYQRWHGGER